MSNRKGNNNDITTLLENLRDLDDISKKIHTELRTKNKIMETGLMECQQCQKMMGKTGQKSIKKNTNRK